MLSTAGIIWFNSQLQTPDRIDVSLPAAAGTLWLRLVRGVGWLLDQQRGLLIYGPIYIAALWGVPVLVTAREGRYRRGIILLPFLVVDLAVASLLMSMGMIMVPPATLSLPIKLLLFVLVDGWNLVTGSILRSFL